MNLIRRQKPQESEGAFEDERTPETHVAVRQRLLESDLAQEEERMTAVLLCQRAGWTDCLTTIVPLEGKVFILTNHDGGLKLRVKGVLEGEVRVEVRMHEFRRHVKSAEWDSLSAETIDGVVRMLGKWSMATR